MQRCVKLAGSYGLNFITKMNAACTSIVIRATAITSPANTDAFSEMLLLLLSSAAPPAVSSLFSARLSAIAAEMKARQLATCACMTNEQERY